MSRTHESIGSLVADVAMKKLREAGVHGTWGHGYGALVEDGLIALTVPGLGRFDAKFEQETMDSLIDFHGKKAAYSLFAESLARQAIEAHRQGEGDAPKDLHGEMIDEA